MVSHYGCRAGLRARGSTPLLLTDNGQELFLDEGTSPQAVQVDFQKFDRLSINISDVWIHILFTEDEANHTQQELEEVRDKIVGRITKSLNFDYLDEWRASTLKKGPMKRPTIAVDIFWGPGHGCMLDEHGSITQSW